MSHVLKLMCSGRIRHVVVYGAAGQRFSLLPFTGKACFVPTGPSVADMLTQAA